MAQQKILHLNASALQEGSFSRRVSGFLVDRLDGQVVERELSEALPVVNARWIEANYTAPEERSQEQKDVLSLSDTLVDELIEADTIVLGAPMYNFNIPASLKLWIDLVARVGRTFHYTEDGPVGLLTGKKAYVVYASGGVPMGAPMDFSTPYLTYILGFMGITDVEFIPVISRAENGLEEAQAQIEKRVA